MQGNEEELKQLLDILYQESLNLKNSIELAEMINNNSSGGLILEQLIKKIVSVKIKMYKENHNKPHVHLDIGNEKHNASICILTNTILAGSVSPKYMKPIGKWIQKNREGLIKVWHLLQDKGELGLSPLN